MRLFVASLLTPYNYYVYYEFQSNKRLYPVNYNPQFLPTPPPLPPDSFPLPKALQQFPIISIVNIICIHAPTLISLSRLAAGPYNILRTKKYI